MGGRRLDKPLRRRFSGSGFQYPQSVSQALTGDNYSINKGLIYDRNQRLSICGLDVAGNANSIRTWFPQSLGTHPPVRLIWEVDVPHLHCEYSAF